MLKLTAWPTYTVLVAGMILRVWLAAVTPPGASYDDHYEPVQVILTKGEVPSAADCWECYQPPLYYLVSAGACEGVRFTESLWTGARELGEQGARRTLQFVSVIAGCATLWVCRAVLRRIRPAGAHEALALCCVAFLPCHIRMSAMATNDALTYLLASLAVYAAVRAHGAGWPWRGCVLTGLLAGLTVLSKGYGWTTVAAIVVSAWFFTRQRTLSAAKPRPWPLREISRPLVLVMLTALPLALLPNVRNDLIYGQPLIDNFRFWSETPLRFQPPGSVRDTSFFSFRFIALLQHPWLHTRHVDSFWTELYGRLWFDYEWFRKDAPQQPAWQRLWDRAAQANPQWNRARWDTLLDYSADDMPSGPAWVARVSYVAGLPLTLLVLAGFVLAARRVLRDFGLMLLVVHFALSAGVPLFQTLRLPHFAAMKAAFALSAVTSAPVFVALALDALRNRRRLQALSAAVFWGLWLVIAAADVALIATP